MLPHKIAIDHDSVRQTISQADQPAINRRDQIAMRALARNYGCRGEAAGWRNREDAGRIVERVDQADLVAAYIAQQLDDTRNRAQRTKGMHGEVRDGDTGCFKLAAAGAFGAKTAGVRLKSSAIQR